MHHRCFICAGPGPSEEDEVYEECVNITNMVYKVLKDELDPVEEYWGKVLRHEMLNEKEVIIMLSQALSQCHLFSKHT